MAEYIERDKAIDACFDGWNNNAHDCAENIRAIPAAGVRPVVRATWKRIDFKPRGHDYECSSCRWKNDMATHFCPNCGADMREES